MKKLFLLLLVSFVFVSCWTKDIQSTVNDKIWEVKDIKWEVDKVKTQVDDAKTKVDNVRTKVNETKWIIEDTTDIIGGYSDTLQWTVNDARSIKESYDSKNQKLQEDIQNAYK